MSLINDALKRAKQAQGKQPPGSPGAPSLPPLPPVETPSRGGGGWLFVILLLVAIACLFIGLAVFVHKPAPGDVALAQPAQSAPVLPKPVPSVVPPAEPPTNAVVAPPKPIAPALKLQGIFYNSDKPQAIVNGQSVYVGDTVAGFRVAAISKNTVSLVAADGTLEKLALNN